MEGATTGFGAHNAERIKIYILKFTLETSRVLNRRLECSLQGKAFV